MNIEEMKLWGLSNALYDVIENGFSFNEETGEVYFTTEDLDKLEMALDDKLNGICGYIKFSESRAESLKERMTEIKNLIEAIDKKNDKLKNVIKMVMEKNDITKKELRDFNLGTRKSSSVVITNEDEVFKFLKSNPQYKELCVKTKIENVWSKKGLKELLKTTSVPGATITESKSIQIS